MMRNTVSLLLGSLLILRAGLASDGLGQPERSSRPTTGKVTIFISAGTPHPDAMDNWTPSLVPIRHGTEKDLKNSVEDLRKRFKKSKQFQLVDKDNAADFILTVKDRTTERAFFGASVQAYFYSLHYRIEAVGTSDHLDHMENLKQGFGTWAKLANLAADRIEDWFSRLPSVPTATEAPAGRDAGAAGDDEPTEGDLKARYELLSTADIPHVRARALEGEAESQFLFGFAHLEGRLVPKDEDEMLRWYSLAAAQGFSQALVALGEAHFRRGDYAEARKYFEQAVEAGNRSGMLGLGNLYGHGQAVDRDLDTAVRWWLQAAELGLPEAQYALAESYMSGTGVRQNDKTAVKWLRPAAERGHKDAQYNLGVMFDEGRGVREDTLEALRWYRRAAAQGDGSAMNNIGYFHQKGRKKVERDGREAVRWYLRAIEYGETETAPHNLARVYEDGIDVPKDIVNAYMWR